MPKVEIITAQSGHSTSQPGIAARALDLYSVGSNRIVFTNSTDGNSGVTRWDWQLLERPPGSSASLINADTDTAELAADKYGRYVVALRVNDMGDNTLGYGKTVASVSYPSLGTTADGDDLGDWDPPAFSEETLANWQDFYGSGNPHGAQRELYRILYQMRMIALPMLIQAGRIPLVLSGALTQVTDQSVWTDAGYSTEFDLADFLPGSVKFGVILLRMGTAGTAKAQLYDVTNAVAIGSSELTATAGPIQLLTGALTVGSSAGNMRNDGDTMYKVQIKIDGGVAGTDYVHIYNAFIQVV